MTTFKGPLRVGDPPTGNGDAYDNHGFVRVMRQIPTGGAVGQTRKIITVPPGTTLVGAGYALTSAIGGVDTAASAMVISVGNSSDATRHASFNVSAGVSQRFITNVSGGTDYDAGGTIVVTVSALSTTTYTGGGRVFLEFVTVE